MLESAQAEDEGASEKRTQKDENPSAEKTDTVFVYVCGYVASPGVYELPSGSRVCDAITAAGGEKKSADAESLNQAEPVTDGMRVYVPSKKESVHSAAQQPEGNAGASSGSAETNGNAAVNLNTATKEELMTLTGIGESKAQSILDYRQTNGSFTKIEDVMKIRGIKEGVFDKIKDQITV